MNKSSYFQYNWIKYLLIVIVPLVFWLIVYSEIDQVKYDESVKILYIGEALDEKKLQEEISSNISFITTQELEYVSVMTYSGVKEQVYEYLRSKIYSVDIVIISDEYLQEDMVNQIFVPLTSKLKQEFSNADFVNVGDNSYGIKISRESIFYKYYSKDENVSVFLSQHSLNIAKAYGYGKVENDSAILIAKYISGVN
jgi:hypothetical protein